MLPGFTCLPRAAILAVQQVWRVCVSEGAAHIADRASPNRNLNVFEIAGPVREEENKSGLFPCRVRQEPLASKTNSSVQDLSRSAPAAQYVRLAGVRSTTQDWLVAECAHQERPATP